MHLLTRWFIHNPVAANLIMVLILVAGALTLTSIRIEGFPKLPADSLQITTVFAGAYAEQVDRQITQKIEKALEGMPGIKKIHATSLEGLSSVVVQKREGYDLRQLQDDVRMGLDEIENLPQEAERAIISRNDFDFPALIVQLYGDTDIATLQRLGRAVRDELLAQPEISKIKRWGEKRAELRIEVYPARLQQYGLTIDDIVETIQHASLTYKAGSLKTSGGTITLRADNQSYRYRDFANIAVYPKRDGSQLLLGDLAKIVDGFEDDDVIVRFNGQPALGMEVLIGRKENLLNIAQVVKQTVAKLQKTLPSEVKLNIWADSSHYIKERLDLLKGNALLGLLLVIVLLALFLNLKLAFWVAMGIPIAVAGAVAVMGSQWLDYSLNDITTFGFIIALGILVDDAVVVGESVFEARKQQSDALLGTQNGVQRVATATIFGVLTSVAALFPMLLIDNALGKIMASFSGVVILALLFSLFESKFILPAHLAYIALEKHHSRSWLPRLWRATQNIARNKLDAFIQRIYKPLLQWSLDQRYAVLLLFVSVAVLGLGMMGTGKIKTVFIPDIPEQLIFVRIEMDARAPYHLTRNNAKRVEAVAHTLNEGWVKQLRLEENPIKHILVVVEGAFMVEIYAELTPPDKRTGLGTLDILKQWREQVGQLEGTTELSFSATEDTGGGFAVELYSKDEARLKVASEALLAYLGDIKGVYNLRDELKTGKPELSLKLKPEAHHLGFTAETLARQIGQRFGGAQAQRVQRDYEEVKVMVINQASSRDTIADLMSPRLKSDHGHWYPLSAVATIESAYITDYIARQDGKRVNTVYASIDKSQAAPEEIEQALFTQFVPDLKRRIPQVTIKQGGELEQIGELKGGLKKALVIICVLIFALLAIPLKSYWQPFFIMSVIPFGFVGALIGHWIMDLPLSMLSFLGMLALTGVVVNDSLVLMTRYSQNRAQGFSVHEAAANAGMARFKAIFLTTATTVIGLMPLMRETSEQAQYLIPAAVSLAYGEIFATAITLILLPVLIAIGADVASMMGQPRKNPIVPRKQQPDDINPAP
jgi:multidrug efflux pump subunit AcrB